ncbi:putative glutathione-specific gamma-glutamylcyclotransferase 2 [Glandiceps talaboti]
MWIYGYGSLIWNPGFEYEEKSIGFVKGFTRKFCIRSDVMRGTPEKPGRSAGLVEEPEAITWGVAYRVNDEDDQTILQHLALREGTTDLVTMEFYPRDRKDGPFDVAAYWALKRSEDAVVPDDYYILDEDITKTAELIATSVGPHGLTNIDYFLKLIEFLNSIEVEDPYISELERQIKIYKSNKV